MEALPVFVQSHMPSRSHRNRTDIAPATDQDTVFFLVRKHNRSHFPSSRKTEHSLACCEWRFEGSPLKFPSHEG